MTSENGYILIEIDDLKQIDIDLFAPTQLDLGGFLLCLKGHAEVVIDTKRYKISPSDLIVAFPYSVIQMLSASSDLACMIIGVPAPFFSAVQLSGKSRYFTEIRRHPSILLNNSELKQLLSLKDMLVQSSPDRPFSTEINESILKIIIYEVATIYDNRKPNTEHKQSREEEIFNNFIFHLFKEYKQHRELSYYAQCQSITASHLSRVVKIISGRGGNEWITDCVINYIKSTLKDSDTSISAICEEFNFANNSFFSQYFKKRVGMTPREYRSSQAKRDQKNLSSKFTK